MILWLPTAYTTLKEPTRDIEENFTKERRQSKNPEKQPTVFETVRTETLDYLNNVFKYDLFRDRPQLSTFLQVFSSLLSGLFQDPCLPSPKGNYNQSGKSTETLVQRMQEMVPVIAYMLE